MAQLRHGPAWERRAVRTGGSRKPTIRCMICLQPHLCKGPRRIRLLIRVKWLGTLAIYTVLGRYGTVGGAN